MTTKEQEYQMESQRKTMKVPADATELKAYIERENIKVLLTKEGGGVPIEKLNVILRLLTNAIVNAVSQEAKKLVEGLSKDGGRKIKVSIGGVKLGWLHEATRHFLDLSDDYRDNSDMQEFTGFVIKKTLRDELFKIFPPNDFIVRVEEEITDESGYSQMIWINAPKPVADLLEPA